MSVIVVVTVGMRMVRVAVAVTVLLSCGEALGGGGVIAVRMNVLVEMRHGGFADPYDGGDRVIIA